MILLTGMKGYDPSRADMPKRGSEKHVKACTC